jgi:predicted transcriptional regulator
MLVAATAKKAARPTRELGKKAIILDLLKRAGGATLDEIVAATAWQKHSVRGFISTLGSKHGCTIVSTRRESDKARVCSIAKQQGPLNTK